jgi:hypothetical protein
MTFLPTRRDPTDYFTTTKEITIQKERNPNVLDCMCPEP